MKKMILLLCLVTISCFGHSDFYRSYWHPNYLGKPLNWCEHSKKNCGKQVAKQYCNKMGYAHVVKVIKANDIGKSRFIDLKLDCNNAFCDGFTLIKCGSGSLVNSEYYTHYARKKVFHYPRVKKSRIDWCFNKGKQCGRRAAYAFCRYQGYNFVSSYKSEKSVSKTRAIGSNELCVGRSCKGFSSITCRHA